MCFVSTLLPSRLFRNLLLCYLFLTVVPLHAQHFVNDALGQFTNSTGAIIRFRAESGEFRNGNPAPAHVRNDGIIEFLGANNRFTGGAALGVNESLRVGGLVRYASSSATMQQQVQARWYSNLALDGIAPKRIESGVYVGGESASTGVFTASGGARFYNGTFFYDNTATQLLLGGEDYQNVEILRGSEPKRIRAGASVRTRGAFRQNSSNGGGLQVFGVLSIGTDGLFPSTFSGTGRIEIGTTAVSGVNNTLPPSLSIGSGRLTIGVQECNLYAGLLATRSENASILIQTGATVRLFVQPSSTSGSVSLGFAGNELIVSGNLRNDLVSGTNATFHTQSTVRYNSMQSQALMQTSHTSPYGHLILENSNKTVFALPSNVPTSQELSLQGQIGIFLAGALRVNSSFVDVGAWEMVMLTPSADAVFVQHSDEVQGAMRRVMASSIRNYTFNNAQTLFRVDSNSTPRDMTLTVTPRREPIVAYEVVRDVRRKVRWHWSGDAAWTGALRLGYRREEIAPPFLAANESSLSMFALTSNNATAAPRLLGAVGVERMLALSNALGFVEFRGLTSQAGTPFSVVSGDTLLLRGGRELVRSVRDGRWSNPTTWNIAREPDAEDSVEINHTVHVGFRRNALDGTTLLGQVWERGAARNEALAQTVSFASAVNSDTSRPAALLVGSFAASDSTFLDEAPPAQGKWSITSAIVRSAPSTTFSNAPVPSREQLRRLRSDSPVGWQGLVVFSPASMSDSTHLQIGSLQNASLVSNGGRIEVSQSLVSTGLIRNNGTVSSRADENVIQQDSIAGWVVFSGDGVGRVQRIPSLRYTNLALAGRSQKLIMPQNDRRFIVYDSLQTSRDAVADVPPTSSIEVRGGVSHDGSIGNASRDALLQLNGVRRQFMRGAGSIDALTMENDAGVVTLDGNITLRAALNLRRGEFQNSDVANCILADNAVITRFPEGSLAVQPIAQGSVSLRTRGESAMTATGELLPRIAVLDVRNRGGYRMTRNVRVNDSLTLASRLWTESESVTGAYTLDFAGADELANPQFLEDSAEIIGTVRRVIPTDTLPRLFNNRYTTLQILSPTSQSLQTTVRVLPDRFPSPTSDTTKVRRSVEIILTSSNDSPANTLVRIGYAWRIQPQDETNDLDAPRVLLQHWNPELGAWQTNGTPRRPTVRSAWNTLADEGLWQYGVMDSVRIMPTSSRFFALGVDSTRTLVPTAFIVMQAFLEGAYLGDGRMKTLLREDGILPRSLDGMSLSVLDGVQNAQFIGEKAVIRALPSDMVDWLLLELRSVSRGMPSDSLRFFLPILLKRNGTIYSSSLQPAVALELPESLESGGRFIATLHHRNHLPVQWRDTLEVAPQRRFALDWSDTSRVIGGGRALRQFGGSDAAKPVFMMLAGDVSDEQHERWSITRFDYDAVMSSAWRNSLREGYLRHDVDADGLITTRDLNLIWNNRNKRRER